MEEIDSFNSLGSNVSYEGEGNLNVKTVNFIKLVKIIYMIFKSLLVCGHMIMQICNTLARSTFLVSNEL